MKILSADQIRSADEYTIKHEPVSSVDLMERAALACANWIRENVSHNHSFKIFCGPGNNGGDGLAIARLLLESGLKAEVFIVRQPGKYSADFLENEKRLGRLAPDSIHDIESAKDFPVMEKSDCVVDALLGTGLSKPVAGLFADVIRHINASAMLVISIDIPSGLYADKPGEGHVIVQADHTLTFQAPKFTFLFSENDWYVGEFHVLAIGLDKKIIEAFPSTKYYVTADFLRTFLRPRNKFSHKGNYGHALLVSGSNGKMGAAVLAAKGCLRTGAGLVSVYVPQEGSEIIHVTCPEAMVKSGEIDFEKYSAIGIGPGTGTKIAARDLLNSILEGATIQLVLDADALNILSQDDALLTKVPENSVLTPHPGEFERLAGKANDDFERHELQLAFSRQHGVIVVLKGAHTCITTPDGISFFNSTGNPGMAKGGSGDVLTGMITSLLAQGYSPLQASLLGVFLHGLAGDIAAEKKGEDGMIARDIVNAIPHGWLSLRKTT
jgi:ADP-dependent NAD(P)H-hydrate dehydratase / NAD(P)H-hydrate epimerase